MSELFKMVDLQAEKVVLDDAMLKLDEEQVEECLQEKKSLWSATAIEEHRMAVEEVTRTMKEDWYNTNTQTYWDALKEAMVYTGEDKPSKSEPMEAPKR